MGKTEKNTTETSETCKSHAFLFLFIYFSSLDLLNKIQYITREDEIGAFWGGVVWAGVFRFLTPYLLAFSYLTHTHTSRTRRVD